MKKLITLAMVLFVFAGLSSAADINDGIITVSVNSSCFVGYEVEISDIPFGFYIAPSYNEFLFAEGPQIVRVTYIDSNQQVIYWEEKPVYNHTDQNDWVSFRFFMMHPIM